jgi:hypothetical protein
MLPTEQHFFKKQNRLTKIYQPLKLQNQSDMALTYLNMRKNCSGVAPVRQLRPKNSSKHTIIVKNLSHKINVRGIKLFGNLIVPRKLPSRESTVTLCLS